MSGESLTETLHDVVGIGNAIVDVLTHTDDEFLERRGMAKGGMMLIDEDSAERLYGEMDPRIEASGGSAANTIAGIASLGGRGAYIGKVSNDSLGESFRSGMHEAGVRYRTSPASGGPQTARCLIFVTGDAQRTMNTFLGASATLAPEDLDEELIRTSAITYLEGYLWDPAPAKEAFLAAARMAHAAGRKVALTLSDSFCVERYRDEFRDLVDNHVDILFGNDTEVRSLYRTDDLDHALDTLRGRCEIAAITRGEHGSSVLHDGRRIDVTAERVEQVVDTTGAGDLFAAGFLFGLSRGDDVERSARIGNLVAAEIISHWGARPRIALSERIAHLG